MSGGFNAGDGCGRRRLDGGSVLPEEDAEEKGQRERKGGDAATPASAVAERPPRLCPEPGNSDSPSARRNK